MNLHYTCLALIVVSMAVTAGCGSKSGAPAMNWQQKLQETIPVFGHRNWIVIADSAYPAQSRSAIETVVSGADQIEVVEKALAAVGASKHVRPTIYTD
jgi:L-fucose mutarotase/ribose pyranase (RbsD/FucU family)